MKYLILVCLIALGLGLITLGLAATPGDPLAAFDPHHTATLLLNVDSRLREFRSAASELVRGLVDEFTAPYRERLRHEGPTQSLPR